MTYWDWIQWPAMVVTVLAAWLIGSQRPKRRMTGFVCFSVSNVLWVIWGAYAGAYALIVLQVCLFLMNLRGLRKNSKGKEDQKIQ
ncbi:YgjV family protein [Pseudomonas sp. Sample_21]|uniref:YgjV family protein n=1 Tax=Pseudomonas sp. Sample_21 TaxID=2448265 RepID=UPI001030CDE0|nr:YgjV family protein [Pseudomonas sp. Sample_21]